MREINRTRVQKIHQLVFTVVFATLIVWPYLRYIHGCIAVTLLLGNTAMLIEYGALLAYLSNTTCERRDVLAEAPPSQT